MDLNGVNNIWGLAAVCVMTLGSFFGGIAYTRRGKGETPEPALGSAPNGYATQDWVRVAIAEQCRDCPSVARLETQITQMRQEVQTGLRGVHDRLDRVLEGKR